MVVVVAEPPGTEDVVEADVVVVVPDCAKATEPRSDVKIAIPTTVAPANPSLDRLRTRAAGRACPDRNDVKFMPAPKCLDALSVHRDCNEAAEQDEGRVDAESEVSSAREQRGGRRR